MNTNSYEFIIFKGNKFEIFYFKINTVIESNYSMLNSIIGIDEIYTTLVEVIYSLNSHKFRII